MRGRLLAAILASSALIVGAGAWSAGPAVAAQALVDLAPPTLSAIASVSTVPVGPGDEVTVNLTASDDVQLAYLLLSFEDGGGKQHAAYFRNQLIGRGDFSSPVHVAIDKSWAPGVAKLVRVEAYDAAGNRADYYRDGTLWTSPSTGVTTQKVQLQAGDFTVGYAGADGAAPLLTSVAITPGTSVHLGDAVPVRIRFTDADPAVQVQVWFRDSRGQDHEMYLDDPSPVDSTWEFGPVRLVRVQLADTSGNYSVYTAGALTYHLPYIGDEKNEPDLATGSFTVAALKLTQTPTPTVTGTPTVGTTMTAHAGVWQPGPVSLSYQWRSNGKAIPGATAGTFKIASAQWSERITVTVTGSSYGYASVSKMSAVTHTVAKPLSSASTPAIVGTARVGTTLTLHRGTWSPKPVALAYQWFANGKPIVHATGITFRPTAAQIGARITLRMTGTKVGYAITARTSAATKPVLKK